MAEKIPTDNGDRVKTYGELFAVEKILPVGSFFEKTKIGAPNEFDFDIMLNVGEIDIHPGCRPGRVQVSFESSRQKWLKITGRLFCTMIETALNAMSLAERNIQRDSGTLHITSKGATGVTQPRLQFKWKGTNREFDIAVDVVPSIPCTDNFIAELGKNEHFPSNFQQLVKDQPCYLVPKPCSPKCRKCFHVSFSQAELYLMQSLDEGHRQCYSVMKLLLANKTLESYKLKMAVLDHVYNTNCQSKGCIDECVLAMLEILLNNYNELKMPTFFQRNCCVITKDGEGKHFLLDYLVDATGLDISMLPTEFYHADHGDRDSSELSGYKEYNWLDLFAWFEFQRRCLSLMIDVLRNFSQVGIRQGLSYGHMLIAMEVFFEKEIGRLPIEENFSNCYVVACGRPTTREWRDKIPNFSQRIFIPAFSLILHKIQVVLKKNFMAPCAWSSPSIPCPAMGCSQGSFGNMWRRDGDHLIRQGAMCYFAQLEGGSWCPVAFGKMSFSDPCDEFIEAYFTHLEALFHGGPRSKLVRGSSLKAGAANESNASGDEIPEFEGPFDYNVRYDGEAFQENIVSRWHYKHCLIRFVLSRMVVALYRPNR